MLLQMDKTDNGANDGAGPHKSEEHPAPIAVVAHGYQGDGRVGAGDMPIDGGVVPFAQVVLPFAFLVETMIDGRGQITACHPNEVEAHTNTGPHAVHIAQTYHDDKCDTHCSGHHGATGVGPCIPDFFFLCIFYCHGKNSKM